MVKKQKTLTLNQLLKRQKSHEERVFTLLEDAKPRDSKSNALEQEKFNQQKKEQELCRPEMSQILKTVQITALPAKSFLGVTGGRWSVLTSVNTLYTIIANQTERNKEWFIVLEKLKADE